MKIQGLEYRVSANIEQLNVTRKFNELENDTPKQDSATQVTISKEGIQSYKDSVMKSSR